MYRIFLTAIAVTMTVTAQPIPDFTPPTPLFRAVLGNDEAEVKRLLDSGVNPNDGRFIGGAPALILSLMQQRPNIAKMLLDKGADVNATDAAGATALMWAATSEVADTSLVKELLSRGVDPNAASKSGDTALSWAMRRGYTPVVEMLKQHGASNRAIVRDSVERALTLLEKSSPEFIKVSGCVSCHNQSIPQMAVAIAKTRGIRTDSAMWDKQAKAVVAFFKPLREPFMTGKSGIPDPAITIPYFLLGLNAAGHKPDGTTEAMAHMVSTQQRPDGSFTYIGARPPMESSPVSATALSVRAIQLFGENRNELIEKAREYLRTVKTSTTEEHTMKLLGLMWTNADPSDIKSAADVLIAQQRPDGGWSQLPTLETDAYATGQALYALMESNAIQTAGKEYQKGVAYLLRTQRPDGSWLVRSRSVPFQPYKESGFPHGKDQWISAAGTGWSAMALAMGLPVEQQITQLDE